MKNNNKPNVHAAYLGRIGGRSTSPAKRSASRANGKLGGRPKGSKNKIKKKLVQT